MKTPDNALRRRWKTYVGTFTIAFFSLATSVLKAQTPLASGDIAFTGYIAKSGTDTVSFMILKAGGIDAGTEIQFTDNGWLRIDSGWIGEGIVKWTASQHLRYGEQVKLVLSVAPSSDKGTVVKLGGSLDLSAAGDQLFAYTGVWPHPDIFLAGFHYCGANSAITTDAGWDINGLATGSSSQSVYPAALCSTCGIWVRDPESKSNKVTTAGYYKGDYNASPAVLRGMINNNANWNNTFSGTSTAPAWNLPPAIVLPDEDPEEPADTTSEEPLDTARPHVIAVTTAMPDGVYKAGDEINITVYFDKNVIVNASGGVPYLKLNIGNDSSTARYVTGSCSSAITFIYTVQPGDTSVRLDYLSSNALQLNNGTIQNSTAANADIRLPGKGNTLAAQKSIVINARPPVITPYQNFAIDRYSSNGAIVGTVAATSHGPAGTALQQWVITQGNVGNVFSINAATGELKVMNEEKLQEEGVTGFVLMLTVSDGYNTAAPEEVMVLLREVALNDTLQFHADSLYENQAVGAVAGRLKLISGKTAVYSLVAGAGDTDNSLFAISGDSLQTSAGLDYEQQQQYSVRVRAAFQSRYIDTALIVNVLGQNEAPTIDAIDNKVVCQQAGTQVLSLTGITAGQDTGQCVTVSVAANHPELFTQLIVIRDSDGTTNLRYRVRDSAAGQAVVTITVKDNGGTANGGVDSVVMNFTITARAAGSIAIAAGGRTALVDNETVTLTATATGIMGALQWFRNGTVVADAQAATYKVDTAHAGAYTCQLNSSDGCTAMSNTIVVTKGNEPVNMMVYPNPTSGKLSIVFTSHIDEYVYMVVYNSSGAEVQRKRIWHGSNTQKDDIDISGYASGMYIISLLSDKGDKIVASSVLKQ